MGLRERERPRGVRRDGRFRGYRAPGATSPRKRAEEALRRFRVALNASADSIFLIDADALQIIDLNDAAARLLGYERVEMLGANPAILFEGRGETDLRAEYERLGTGGEATQFFRAHFRRKDGALCRGRLASAPARRRAQLCGRHRARHHRTAESRGAPAAELERFEIVARATTTWCGTGTCSPTSSGATTTSAACSLRGRRGRRLRRCLDRRIHPEDAAG